MAEQKTNGVYLTKAGLDELKKELDDLMLNKRPKLIKRVAMARDFGDLAENAEYATSREELTFVEGRIEELQDIIARAKLIQNGQNGHKKVSLGSKITVKVNNNEHVYTVVGQWEADPAEKKISHDSPLGHALLGKKEGDIVEVAAPAGTIAYHIVKIH
jgi:transcription elongation factor GreA